MLCRSRSALFDSQILLWGFLLNTVSELQRENYCDLTFFEPARVTPKANWHSGRWVCHIWSARHAGLFG